MISVRFLHLLLRLCICPFQGKFVGMFGQRFNRSYFGMKITQSPLCSFCTETDESGEHLFWEYICTVFLLQSIDDFYINILASNFNVRKQDFIIGDVKGSSKDNLISIQIKYCIQYDVWAKDCRLKETLTKYKLVCIMYNLNYPIKFIYHISIIKWYLYKVILNIFLIWHCNLDSTVKPKGLIPMRSMIIFEFFRRCLI